MGESSLQTWFSLEIHPSSIVEEILGDKVVQVIQGRTRLFEKAVQQHVSINLIIVVILSSSLYSTFDQRGECVNSMFSDILVVTV